MKKFALKHCAGAAALAVVLAAVSEAEASLATSYTFQGNGNWSIDAVGSNSDPVGSVSAIVPTGSTVVKAFLYTSQYATTGLSPNISLDGTTYSGAAWTNLGSTSFPLTAWRADVTTQMIAAIGGGSAVPFSFSVREILNNGNTDGEVLVIVYENPGDLVRTIAIADGFSATGGDSTTITFNGPVDTGISGFEALLSLGIGFGFQPSGQFSIVDGNGRRLTSSAGGQDDGGDFNGGLITVGGIGDSSTNPDPFASDAAGPRTDDELYNLALGNSADANPFLANGSTSYTFRTSNPSNDDNIFFLGMNITAEASIATGVPLPPAVWGGLAMLGLLGVARHRRRVKPLV